MDPNLRVYDEVERVQQRMDGLRQHHKESAEIYERTQPIINEQIHEETMKYLQVNGTKKSQKPRAKRQRNTAQTTSSIQHTPAQAQTLNQTQPHLQNIQPIPPQSIIQQPIQQPSQQPIQQPPQSQMQLHPPQAMPPQPHMQRSPHMSQQLRAQPTMYQSRLPQQQQQQQQTTQAQPPQSNFQQQQQQQHFQPHQRFAYQQSQQTTMQNQQIIQTHQVYTQQPQVRVNIDSQYSSKTNHQQINLNHTHNHNHNHNQNHNQNHNHIYNYEHQSHQSFQNQHCYGLQTNSLPNDFDFNLQAGLECDVGSVIKHEISVGSELEFDHDFFQKILSNQ